MNRKLPLILLVLAVLPAVLAAGCSKSPTPGLVPETADLVICTYQEEAVYSPIIKEYQERTGLNIQVISSSYAQLQEQVLAGTLPGCDLIFGVDAAMLESAPANWDPYISPEADLITAGYTSAGGLWTGFSVRPLVIMYNTRVVTYRELPESWNSLLEPRWNGRIAFMEPTLYDTYAFALTSAVHTAGNSEEYVNKLAENMNYITFDSLSGLNLAIAEGRSFVGVTTEEKAVSLIAEGADIDYIYPPEGISVLIDGTAIRAGCDNPVEARAFIDFTVSKDVQYFLTSAIRRRPVRTDILPPAGLSPLSDVCCSSVSLRGEYEHAVSIWNNTFDASSEERR